MSEQLVARVHAVKPTGIQISYGNSGPMNYIRHQHREALRLLLNTLAEQEGANERTEPLAITSMQSSNAMTTFTFNDGVQISLHQSRRDLVRKALVAEHMTRERVNVKPFYVGSPRSNGMHPVWDFNMTGAGDSFIEEFRDATNAAAFAKLLNRNYRKAKGGEA